MTGAYLDATYVTTSQTYGEYPRHSVKAQGWIRGLEEDAVGRSGMPFIATWAVLETECTQQGDRSAELKQVTFLQSDEGDEFSITPGLRSDLAELLPPDWQDAALAAYGEAMGAEPIPEAVSA